MSQQNSRVKVCLIGATLDTGNMGVGALAEASVKCILHSWPDAEVTILSPGRVATEHHLRLSGREVCLRRLPIRFGKCIFSPDHFCVLFFCAVLMKVIRWKWIRQKLLARVPSLRAIAEANVGADITGGDSFSDIYGMYRLAQLSSLKLLILMLNKKLVLLPQTYGPFNRRTSRVIARYILNHASVIYSRDKSGIGYVRDLLGHRAADKKIQFCPDVAFTLDARKPVCGIPQVLVDARANTDIVVGLNISGLLFRPDGMRDNQFDLAVPYVDSVMEIVKMLLANETVAIFLIPHTFSQVANNHARPPILAKAAAEGSDTEACRHIYERAHADYPGRLFVVEGWYDQAEIKYIIGKCDFLIGARMHACIAAISQNIPAVGIAYSEKFQGVFDSIGLGDCVADLRTLDKKQLIEKVESIFHRRDQISEHLAQIMPSIKRDVLNLFGDFDL